VGLNAHPSRSAYTDSNRRNSAGRDKGRRRELCGHQARSGFYPRVPKAPFPLGFEIAGVVKGIGKDVEGLKEGDSIAAITQGRENPKESRMRYFC
jgi:hypothetical protein